MDKKQREGYGKILDAWMSPEGAGEPIGCVATTFTFSSAFFEGECLSRFLCLETSPDEDGPIYLIEREEKLAGIYASVLVDQHNCTGNCTEARSLRWDLLSARIPKGVLHAKISILYWSNFIRLIIGSANITESGYRKNQEIFGVLDYYADSKTPLAPLFDTLSYLEEIIRYANPDSKDRLPAITRWNKFLEKVRSSAKEWGLRKRDIGRKSIKINTVFIGPGQPSVFKQLETIWPSSSPPAVAYITSPFFDPPDAQNTPAREIWNILKQKGKAEVIYNVLVEDIPNSKALFIRAPRSLLENAPYNRDKVNVKFQRLEELQKTEDGKEIPRQLHLKSIWLEGDNYNVVYMIGSSNFTSAGIGLVNNPNLEANIVYIVNNKKLYWMLDKSYLYGFEEIDPKTELQWQKDIEQNEDDLKEMILLPSFFKHAMYGCNEKGESFIMFYFGKNAPKDWAINCQGNDKPFFDELSWKKEGATETYTLPWIDTKPPAGFEIRWRESGGVAWLPVNVEKSSSLPPPEEIKNLPLETLIDILTSARPLHQTMRNWLRKKKSNENIVGPIVDPHKRVDTSAFLLQRTRRVSDALCALRTKLEKPVMTKESLEWRLYGPVGVGALAKAISNEAKSEQEKSFLLTELALELSRIKLQTVPSSLSSHIVKKAITQVIDELRQQVFVDSLNDLPNLKEYVESAFREILV